MNVPSELQTVLLGQVEVVDGKHFDANAELAARLCNQPTQRGLAGALATADADRRNLST